MGVTLRYAEAITNAYQREYELDTRIIRIFNTYGPRMDPRDGRVITNFIRQAINNKPLTIYGEGTQTRSFQYIDDLIEAIIRLMDVNYSKPLNIGRPVEYSINELAELITNITGVKSEKVYCELPSDDPQKRCPNIDKAMELLDWKPRINLESGLCKTIQYIKTNIS